MKSKLAIILLALLPLFLSFYLNIFNNQFYDTQFEKLNVYEKFPNALEFNKQTLNYLKNKQTMPTTIQLNERELSHMGDVRNVFSYSLIFFYLLLLISGLILFFSKNPLRLLFKSGIVSIILSIGLLIFFGLFFQQSFALFHSLFFEEGSWIFLPADNIIQLYPVELFFQMSINIFIVTILFSIMFILIGKQKSLNTI